MDGIETGADGVDTEIYWLAIRIEGLEAPGDLESKVRGAGREDEPVECPCKDKVVVDRQLVQPLSKISLVY